MFLSPVEWIVDYDTEQYYPVPHTVNLQKFFGMIQWQCEMESNSHRKKKPRKSQQLAAQASQW